MGIPFGFTFPAQAVGSQSILIRPKRGFFPSVGSPNVFNPITAQATIEEMHADELVITSHPIEQNAPITDHAYKMPSELVIRMAWSNSPTIGLDTVPPPWDFSTNARNLIFSRIQDLVNQTVNVVTFPATQFLAAARQKVIEALTPYAGFLPPMYQAPWPSTMMGYQPGQAIDMYNQLLDLQQSRILFDIYTGKRYYNNMLIRMLTVTTDKQTENVLMVTAACQQIIVVQTKLVQMPFRPDQVQTPASFAPLDLGGNNIPPPSTDTHVKAPVDSGQIIPQLKNYTPITQQVISGQVGLQ